MTFTQDRVLQLTHVSKGYMHAGKRMPVLKEVTLHIDRGEFVTILGPSGSGKSTLFKIIAGLVSPDQGSVEINPSLSFESGMPVVGYMPQKDLLLPWKNLIDNAALPLIAQNVPKKVAYQKVRQKLSLFGLEEFEQAYPHQLSGGMRQRVALLRTMMMGSELLLLDEPFASLDTLTREKLQVWLLEILQLFHKSILFITHSIDEAVYLSDRVYVISHRPGEIIHHEDIELQRPRKREIITSKAFIEIKSRLVEIVS